MVARHMAWRRRDILSWVGIALALGFLQETAAAASFADYFPLDPQAHGIKTFRWTRGFSGTFTRWIDGKETVAFGDGATFVGTYIANGYVATDDSGWELMDALVSSDGSGVQMLGTRDYYLAGDPNMIEPARAEHFAEFADGDIRPHHPLYFLRKADLTLLDSEGTSIGLLLDIQPAVTVPSGTYSDAVILWYLDADYPYVTPEFLGKDTELGITLPTSQRTVGRSLTDFVILARDLGEVAWGDVDAESGTLAELYELKAWQVPEPATLGLVAVGAAAVCRRRSRR